MINVVPNFNFEAVLDCGSVGLAGTVGLEINDNLGTTIQSFDTNGVVEIAPGVYAITKTAPGTAGQYTLIWRASAGGVVLGVEDLVVTPSAVPPIGPPPIIPPPPPPGGMTFKQIQDECVMFRFGEGRRASIKMWINRRMQAVWGEAEWPFKRVNKQTVSTLNGVIVMPVGFRRSIALQTSDDSRLEYTDPEEYRAIQVGSNGATPSRYTVWNGQILFDAIPQDGTPFLLSYLRRICVYNGAGVLVEGLMVNDNDRPLWDPEYHYLLVLGATSTGLKLENDFTWNALEDEFGQALMEMKDDLLPPDTVGTTQYGADNL